jgi:hypothetical protein
MIEPVQKSPDEPIVADICLTAEWLVLQAVDFPWELLAGAQVETADGDSLLVRKITMRPWPNGPLLELVDSNGLDKKARIFNLKGFQSGYLSSIRWTDESPCSANSLRLKMEQSSQARRVAEDVERAKRKSIESNRKRKAELEREAQADAMREQLRLAEEVRRRAESHQRERVKRAREEAKAKAAARREIIKQHVEHRSIERLCHFTRLRNLSSILQHGVLSRSKIANTECPVICNDPERFDRRLDRISLSVTFPNYKLFYRYQRQDSHIPDGDQWVVLLINPQICWTHDALFCRTNAASATVSRLHDDALSSPEAFESLFDDQLGNQGRELRRLPLNFTWDPQAEVLVKDRIAPDNIMCMAFPDHASCDAAQRLVAGVREWLRPPIDFAVDRLLFKPRHDYEYWKNPGTEAVEAASSTRVSCPW